MIGVLIDIISGVIFLYLGFEIGHKGTIKLIHSYHYKNVKDTKGYTKNIGIGCNILGIGLIVVGILSYLGYETQSGYLTFAVIIIALSWMVKTQFKYNGSIF